MNRLFLIFVLLRGMKSMATCMSQMTKQWGGERRGRARLVSKLSLSRRRYVHLRHIRFFIIFFVDCFSALVMDGWWFNDVSLNVLVVWRVACGVCRVLMSLSLLPLSLFFWSFGLLVFWSFGLLVFWSFGLLVFCRFCRLSF